MKRSLIFCAVAFLAVAAGTARADVEIQVNLRYDDPNNESAGGTWDLLVESTDTDGVIGVVAVLDNVTGVAASGTVGWEVFQTQTIGTAVEIVTGSNLVSAATDVGVAGGTGVEADDLFTSGSPWTHSSKIASGDFGSIRPTFTTIASISASTGANTISTGGVVGSTLATMGRLNVRGDSVLTDGLLPGDANRDGTVNGLDLAEVANNFNGSGGWAEGDFDSTGSIDGLDLADVADNFNLSATPPAISAVPEPGSLALALLGMSVACFRRR